MSDTDQGEVTARHSGCPRSAAPACQLNLPNANSPDMGGELARQGGNKVRIDTSPGAGIEAKAAKPTKFYHHLYVQVLIGLALGIVVGVLWPEFGASLKIFGDGFVKVVKMMIAPVVFCTIVLGITSMNDKGEIWKT